MHRRTAIGTLTIVALWSYAARAEDAFFDSNGVKIHYVVEGKGEPVLLIHGFTANIQFQWALPGVIKALAKDYQVIALDNRGHGKSDKPHDPKKYGVEMVEDAVRLLDHLKLKDAHVVGYSMGSIITGKLLATHPERVRSAVLGGSGGLREGGDTSFFDQMADSLERGDGLTILIERLTPPGRPKPTADEIKALNTMLTFTNDTKALAAVARGLKELAVSDEKHKSNRVPTLALIGADDPLKAGVDLLKGRMANLEVVVIDNADHMTAFTKPEFAEAIKGFLAKHRQAKPEAAKSP
jgi:pimeloyl-ACP methyl ester carboxylesterase